LKAEVVIFYQESLFNLTEDEWRSPQSQSAGILGSLADGVAGSRTLASL
jgi:hypothetical protein